MAKLLSAARPQQLPLVVAHQPAASALPEERINLLCGHDAALRAWSAAGADLVPGGHIHLPYTLAVEGLPRQLSVLEAGGRSAQLPTLIKSSQPAFEAQG